MKIRSSVVRIWLSEARCPMGLRVYVYPKFAIFHFSPLVYFNLWLCGIEKVGTLPVVGPGGYTTCINSNYKFKDAYVVRCTLDVLAA